MWVNMLLALFEKPAVYGLQVAYWVRWVFFLICFGIIYQIVQIISFETYPQPKMRDTIPIPTCYLVFGTVYVSDMHSDQMENMLF